MIVYRDATLVLEPAGLLAGCRRLARAVPAAPYLAVELLIEVGMLEAGLTDRLCPEQDDDAPELGLLRGASLASAHLVLAAAAGEPLAEPAGAVQAALAGLDAVGGTAPLTLGVPEGYAWYGLDPLGYAAAAGRLAAERPPGAAFVLGLRSIGTSLAAMVAAALQRAGWRVNGATVRPRGHPFDRRPRLGPALARRLTAPADLVLLIDEGPGLSGSSLTGTAAALIALGVPPARIVLVPGHLPDPASFNNAAAQAIWRRLRKLDTATTPWPATLPDAVDLSAGAWRRDLAGDPAEWPAVIPTFERPKWRAPGSGDGRPVRHRFAGYGRFGRATAERATRLAEAGLGPAPLGLRQGYLTLPELPGRPIRATEAPPIAAFVRHTAFLGRCCSTGRAVGFAPLLAMLRGNLTAALGPAADGVLAGLEREVAAWGQVPEVAVDGRHLAHEWLLTLAGPVKADALDHHADHWWPGCTDLAWDAASFVESFRLSDDAAQDLARTLGDRTGDGRLWRRLPMARLCWLAFRAAFLVTAVSRTDGQDAARLDLAAEAVQRRLRDRAAALG